MLGNEMNVKRYVFNNVECLIIIFFKVVKSFCKIEFCYLLIYYFWYWNFIENIKGVKLICKVEMLFKEN